MAMHLSVQEPACVFALGARKIFEAMSVNFSVDKLALVVSAILHQQLPMTWREKTMMMHTIQAQKRK
jgi:hypothetical protein